MASLSGQAGGLIDDNTLRLPVPGDHGLRIISPSVLELTMITAKEPDPAPVAEWNFVGPNYQFHPPALTDFVVTVGGRRVDITATGFKRRAAIDDEVGGSFGNLIQRSQEVGE